MTDIEIARGALKQDISDIARKLSIPSSNLVCYGNDKAKVRDFYGEKQGKLF